MLSMATVLGINVYLHEEINLREFMESVKEIEGESINNIIELQQQIGTMLDGMGGVFAAIAAGIVAVTVFIAIKRGCSD